MKPCTSMRETVLQAESRARDQGDYSSAEWATWVPVAVELSMMGESWYEEYPLARELSEFPPLRLRNIAHG